MNIIIPLGGKGERFLNSGYNNPKPLIPVFNKSMIEHVLDNLILEKTDNVFIIYNIYLDEFDFYNYIKNKYPFIHLIPIGNTKGAVETLYIGLNTIIQEYKYHKKCILLDCDTFYTDDIVSIFRNSQYNIVFYKKNQDSMPIYSYIDINKDAFITNIQEKIKISNNANTGAYAFTQINELFWFCKYILDMNITFNNEPYTSCVISEMIKTGILFKGYELNANHVFSLGTPKELDNYIRNTALFLFDLDGTMVITDDIYFDVWSKILNTYNIYLTKEIFSQFIEGTNDRYVLMTLLKNISISLSDLSAMKDKLFIESINKLKVIEGLHNFLSEITILGHKACIVTNCNRTVADKIMKYIHIENYIDFLITWEDCKNGKPEPEPYIKALQKYNNNKSKYFIFEDSKSGILSGKGVNPDLLIGIETIYNKTTLYSIGADMTVSNFLGLTPNDIIHITTNKPSIQNKNIENNLIKKIKEYTPIESIMNVIIDNSKLKIGFIADVVNVIIETSNGNKYSQIVKYENTSQNVLSKMAIQLDLYEREYYFYTNISTFVNVNIPKYYNLLLDDEFHKSGIVLENLFSKKYHINLNLNIESIDVTLKIVDRMARMHARFWNKPLKALFPNLKNSMDPCFHPFIPDFIIEKYQLFKSKWFHIFSQRQMNICEKVFIDFPNVQKRFSTGKHLTFIHGDIKSPNIFYDLENGCEPYFIDWQHCAIGKGIQDLVFFIIESFDISNIMSIFHLCKEYYYKKIVEYKVIDYSISEYEKDIYDAICYIPFFTSIWFGTIPQDELIDKNFPYFLISKLFYLLEYTENIQTI
jgi:HAD superfamily hydrolase (TIGR01509 family)